MSTRNDSWIWTLRGFRDDRGKSIVQEWYDSQQQKVQAEFDTRFKYLRVRPIWQWVLPAARQLRGKCNGFIEVRFEVERIPYRAVGYTESQRVFTVLEITDKQHFDPECQRVSKRRKLIEQNKGKYTHEPDCFSDFVKEAQEQELQRRLRRRPD